MYTKKFTGKIPVSVIKNHAYYVGKCKSIKSLAPHLTTKEVRDLAYSYTLRDKFPNSENRRKEKEEMEEFNKSCKDPLFTGFAKDVRRAFKLK